MEKAWKEKHNNTDGNLLSFSDHSKNLYFGSKKGEEVSVNKGQQFTGKCPEEDYNRLGTKKFLKTCDRFRRKKSLELVNSKKADSESPYSLNPKINVGHTKGLIKKIKNAMNPGRQQISNICKSFESDTKIESPKSGPEKNWKETDVKYTVRNRHNNDDFVIIYKRHKRRHHLERIGEAKPRFSKSCKRDVNVQMKRSLSEPRRTCEREISHAEKKSPQESEIPFRIQFLNGRDGPQSKEREKLRSRFKEKRPCRSKSSADSRAESGKRLKQMADRKLNLHREMIRSLTPFKKNIIECTSHGKELPLRPLFIQKVFESPDNSKQNIFEEMFNYQGLEKLAAWSQVQVKTRDRSPPGFSSHQPKIFTDNGREELKLIHRLNCEFKNPFSSKSTTPVEQYWKNTTFESSVQNDTELDKLSLMEISLLNSNVSSRAEGLKYKLPKELKQHSEFIKKISKLRKESPESCKMVKSSKSDSKILRSKTEYEKTESDRERKIAGHPTGLVLVYPLWQKLLRKEKVKLKEKPAKKKSVRHKHSSHRGRKCSKNSHEINVQFVRGKCLDSTERPTGSSTSVCSHRQRKKRKDYCRKEHKHGTVSIFCCEECMNLKRKVNCLEKEVEEIKKKISCLDSQPSAGETCKIPEMNINGLRECKQHQRSCHYHREDQKTHPYHHQEQQQNEREKFACYPTKTTSFETMVHNSKNRDLHVKSTTSDCHLNVGMEIKMENVDPVTGKKLKGEVRRDFQQDGNIQCRLFEDGQAPLLVLDTDFQYNPHTGMLFKNQKLSNATSQSTNIVLPLKSSKERKTLLINSTREFPELQNSHQTFACTQKMSTKAVEKKSDSRKCMSLEHNELNKVDRYPHEKSKKSQSLESSNNNTEKKRFSKEKEPKKDLSLEEKESKARALLKEKSENELPQPSKSSLARSKRCRKPKSGKSLIPTRKKPTPSLVGRSTSGTSTLSLAFSTKSSVPDSYSPTSSKLSTAGKSKKLRIIERTFLKSKEKTDKSTQTFVKKARSIGMDEENQTSVHEFTNTGTQTLENTTKEIGVKTSVASFAAVKPVTVEQSCNVEPEVFPITPSIVETPSAAAQEDWKKNCLLPVDIGLQTNLQSEEVQQYLKDLQIQKKVNLAIAELCFHLAKGEKMLVE